MLFQDTGKETSDDKKDDSSADKKKDVDKTSATDKSKDTFKADNTSKKNTAGTSSSVKKVTVGKGVISTVKATSFNRIKITWKKASNAGKYQIFAKAGKGKYKKIATVAGTSYIHKKLKTGTKYSYYIRPFTTVNKKTVYGVKSKVKSATPVLGKVSSLKVKAKAKKKALVTFKKVSGANGYKISYRLGKKGKWKTVSAKKGSVTLKKLKSRKTVYVRVAVYRTVSGKKVFGKYSNIKSVKVK